MKILFVKTSSLGDIIHSFTALNYIKKKIPRAQIDWVVEKPFEELVKAHPFVNDTIVIRTKQWRQNLFSSTTRREMVDFKAMLTKHQYDVIFDLQGNLKSGFITFFAKSNHKVGFGWKTLIERPNFFFTNKHYNPPANFNVREENLYLVQSYFQDLAHFQDEGAILKISRKEQDDLKLIVDKSLSDTQPVYMVCPGSAWKNKQLSTGALLEFLKKVQLKTNCKLLFVWGSISELKMVQELSLNFPQSKIIDKLSIPVLQNLMAKMDLVIAMDSLPLHLAGTTKTPTFSVFGASSSQKYRPYGDQHISTQGTCPYGMKFERRCPVLRTCQTGACIRDIHADKLLEAFSNKFKFK